MTHCVLTLSQGLPYCWFRHVCSGHVCSGRDVCDFSEDEHCLFGLESNNYYRVRLGTEADAVPMAVAYLC